MSTTPNSIPGQIRNIQQSVQYRDIIKQASDVIVFIDGQDYMINPYLGTEGVVVPINDYVTSWQSSYGVDNTIPSGSLTLVVSSQDAPLFQAPGGNNILRTMADIRIFAKGYYLSPRGNTLYHQIFKGFTSSVSYTVTDMQTTITVTCFGSLGMLEKMQVEQNPAIMSSSPQEVTPMTSTSWNLDPYQSIAWVFLYSSMIDGFERYSLVQAVDDKTSPYYEAIEENFVAKWQAILYDIARDVHIFGARNVQDVISEIQRHVKPPDATNTDYRKEALGALGDVVGAKQESDQNADQQYFLNQLRGYMPDFGIGSFQLLNGRVTSRLERLRYLVNSIGFEAYQDVDGGIIIKTPLYNLDVVNLGTGTTATNNGTTVTFDSSLGDLSDTNNPFVVQLAEILTETETEDEAGVRLTRVTARGNFNPGFQWSASKDQLATAEDIDFGKLSQFGLRTEAPREAHWLKDSDPAALYAFAASEMARANSGLRTYNITIPMRPEIKLGFPMYFPHKDIYGYVRSVSMSWTRGGSATTTVMLDNLRRRPLLPETQKVTDSTTGQTVNKTFMTPQTNLILQWTSAAAQPSASGSTSAASLPGNLASLPVPQKLIVNQAQQIIDARKKGNDFGVNSDTAANCWRIQLENGDQNLRFDYDRPLNAAYYTALQSRRPYTDQKGYEVIGPFPWGRWRTLKEALTVFTISDALGAGLPQSSAISPVSSATDQLSNAAAFLFTGDSVLSETDSATELNTALANQTGTSINNYKVFELSYDANTATSDQSDSSTAQAGLPSTLSPSVPTSLLNIDPNQILAARASTLVSSTATSTSFSESILQTVPLSSLDPGSPGTKL